MITATERKYLLSSVKALLSEYDYEYTDDALNKILTEWATKKAPLIKAFKKHPNYIKGKFMIVEEKEYTRTASHLALRNFLNWICNYVVCNRDYISTLPKSITDQRISDCCPYLPCKLYNFMFDGLMYYNNSVTISADFADEMNELVPEVKAHKGEKMTRLVNRLCTYLNYHQHPDYNKKYAEYTDAVSPKTFKRYTVLSLNPLDYLTMSFGNSWSSCHTIDKTNKRGMPNSYEGVYSSGTMSYMLDAPSMILYTVEQKADKNEYWKIPKIHRQMFHYGEEKLVQGRLYPQSNDGYSDTYTPYRKFVQNILSEIYDIEDWSDADEVGREDTYSWGTHYRDYNEYDDCNVTYVNGINNEHELEIGAYPICIYCGKRHRKEDNIRCSCSAFYRCAKCGKVHSTKENLTFIEGYAYCNTCVSWCDCCQSYHGEFTYHIASENINVCYTCRDRYYTRCNRCYEYVPLGTLTRKDGMSLCPDCLTAQN